MVLRLRSSAQSVHRGRAVDVGLPARGGAGAAGEGMAHGRSCLLPEPGSAQGYDRDAIRLAARLRRTAARRPDRDPVRRRYDPLLHDRLAEARTQLLEIALVLEHSVDPDRASLAALRRLLTEGCDSPLYNSDVHVSELLATLFYVHSWLAGP